MKFHVGQRFKNRYSKRKAEIIRVQTTPGAGTMYTLQAEDNGNRCIINENAMITQWYHIPKGEGKRKEDKPVASAAPDTPVPLKGKAK